MPARVKWVSHSGLPLGYYVGAIADSWQTIRIAPWIRTITVSAAKCKNQQVSFLPTHLYQAKILDKTNIVSQREQQRLKLRLVTKLYTQVIALLICFWHLQKPRGSDEMKTKWCKLLLSVSLFFIEKDAAELTWELELINKLFDK